MNITWIAHKVSLMLNDFSARAFEAALQGAPIPETISQELARGIIATNDISVYAHFTESIRDRHNLPTGGYVYTHSKVTPSQTFYAHASYSGFLSATVWPMFYKDGEERTESPRAASIWLEISSEPGQSDNQSDRSSIVEAWYAESGKLRAAVFLLDPWLIHSRWGRLDPLCQLNSVLNNELLAALLRTGGDKEVTLIKAIENTARRHSE